MSFFKDHAKEQANAEAVAASLSSVQVRVLRGASNPWPLAPTAIDKAHSRATTLKHLRALERKGLVHRYPNFVRSTARREAAFRTTPLGDAVLASDAKHE